MATIAGPKKNLESQAPASICESGVKVAQRLKIYTKTGDDGTTGLYGPGRISKASDRMDAIGDIDELNASLGYARGVVTAPMIGEELLEIQSRLFDLGAELASPQKALKDLISTEDIDFLERSIDQWTQKLPPLTAFILPGGSRSAASLHLCRTICRRAERKVVALHASEPVRQEPRIYINRLSDWLFTVARACNFLEKVTEIEWHPKSTEGSNW